MDNINDEFAIEVKDADVFLGGKKIIKNLELKVKKGERCFILGANGAGKTTLVRMLMGYSWPVYGATIKILGETFGHVNLLELRKKIAWVSPYIQRWSEPEMTGLEMVVSGLEGTMGIFRKVTLEEETKAIEVMERMNCVKLKDQAMVTMSSGEQVKILIARSLMTNPELVILDEPSVYLDIAGREFLLNSIAEMARNNPETTIIFITQRIEDIMPEFDTGLILKDGIIQAQGDRESVLTEENLSKTFDLNLKLVKSQNGRLWAFIQ